jgi:small subunit ribosomal protein S11
MPKAKAATEEKVVKTEAIQPAEPAAEAAAPAVKVKGRRVDSAVLNVESTYNNTKLVLADQKGGTLAWATSGSIGFKSAKKGTPFAAAKVGETLAAKAATFGVKEVKVVIKGVGSGRESAIRGFISKGINLTSIEDRTPVPHNGPKPPKPRRN